MWRKCALGKGKVGDKATCKDGGTAQVQRRRIATPSHYFHKHLHPHTHTATNKPSAQSQTKKSRPIHTTTRRRTLPAQLGTTVRKRERERSGACRQHQKRVARNSGERKRRRERVVTTVLCARKKKVKEGEGGRKVTWSPHRKEGRWIAGVKPVQTGGTELAIKRGAEQSVGGIKERNKKKGGRAVRLFWEAIDRKKWGEIRLKIKKDIDEIIIKQENKREREGERESQGLCCGVGL